MGAIACWIFALTELIFAWLSFAYQKRLPGALLAAAVIPTAALCGYFYRDMLVNSGKPTYLLGWDFLPFVPASLGLFLLGAAACMAACALRPRANF